jgi:hypothetical protein
VDRTFYGGLSVVNRSGSSAVLTFTAYDQNGDMITVAGVTNPVDKTLAAGAQLTILGHELFGGLLADHNAIGWVEIESSVEEISALAMVFDATLSTMDGTPVTGTQATHFLFPEIDTLGFTHLQVANPHDQPTQMTFELRSSIGETLGSAIRVVQGKAALSEAVASLFPGIALEAAYYVRVSSDLAVAALQTVGRPGQDPAGLLPLTADDGAQRVYAPHYTAGGANRTTLAITNFDDSDATLTMRLVGDDGAQIGPTRVLDINGNGKLFIDDQGFFGGAPGNPVEGYVIIQSNGPRISGNVMLGDATGTSLTALPLTARIESSLFFGHVASSESFAMNLGLVNPGDAPATVTVELDREDGTLESSATVTVPAHQRLNQALTAYFPGLEGQTRSTGYLRVTSETGITGFVTIRTGDQKAMFALLSQR